MDVRQRSESNKVTMTHPCNRCGQPFEPTPDQIAKRHWRCPDCRAEDNRARYQKARAKKVKTPKVCTVCRGEFFPPDTWDGRRQKTCSRTCGSVRATNKPSNRFKQGHIESVRCGVDPDFDSAWDDVGHYV